jgi:large exoprotein involved in heme utilization and adhesion
LVRNLGTRANALRASLAIERLLPARRRTLFAFVAGLASSLALALPVAAQVTTDGSVGSAVAGPVLPGIDDRGDPATYLIHDGLGEQVGGNLYHSFGEFSIQTGETATFTSSDPPSVDRILSRVTGGLRSGLVRNC